MAEKLDSRQVATFEELLRACLHEQEALRRVLVRKGVLINEEVLEEIKAVRRELEATGRWCREGESNPHGREGPTDFECKPQRSKFNNFKELGVQDPAKHTIS